MTGRLWWAPGTYPGLTETNRQGSAACKGCAAVSSKALSSHPRAVPPCEVTSHVCRLWERSRGERESEGVAGTDPEAGENVAAEEGLIGYEG